MPNDQTSSINIRMYRHGLGDCFLLTFRQPDRPDISMMIDCGILQGTPNAGNLMTSVAKDIGETVKVNRPGEIETRMIDHVLLTHEHYDHTSGFTLGKSEFEKIEFGQVWTSWLDDKNHKDYMAVREQFRKQILGLTAAVSKMNSDSSFDVKQQINSIMHDFFDEELLGANGDGDLEKRSKAWAYAIDRSKSPVKYCVPGNVFIVPGLEKFRFYVLGPPLDFTKFSSVDPPPEETFRPEKAKMAIADSFFAAVAGTEKYFAPELCQPFEDHMRVPLRDASRKTKHPFFTAHYGFKPSKDDWRRIGDDWLMTAGALALNLDNFTNNTCLAIAIEFIDSGKVLLFPGDAQFANWDSWQKLIFTIESKTGDKEDITVADLLARTVFYKVGHHGSHNATLKKHGLDLMTHPALTAMIPVNRRMASSKTSSSNPKGWEMPEKNLQESLFQSTRGRVIFADEPDTIQLRERCKENNFIDRINFGGESFVRTPLGDDPPTPAEPLYVEYAIDE